MNENERFEKELMEVLERTNTFDAVSFCANLAEVRIQFHKLQDVAEDEYEMDYVRNEAEELTSEGFYPFIKKMQQMYNEK